MPLCYKCLHQVPASDNKKTEATKRVWCPTWLGSQRGPMDVCDECAKTFQPEHNHFSCNGSFHWGEDADKAFKQVEQNIPSNDARYENAVGMAVNGTKLHKHRVWPGVNGGLYVVDGKVWLVASYNVLCLGNLDDARETFPKLFVDEN